MKIDVYLIILLMELEINDKDIMQTIKLSLFQRLYQGLYLLFLCQKTAQ